MDFSEIKNNFRNNMEQENENSIEKTIKNCMFLKIYENSASPKIKVAQIFQKKK
jgi:hypothetical protein